MAERSQTGKSVLQTGDLGIRAADNLFHICVQCSVFLRQAFAEILLVETGKKTHQSIVHIGLLMEIV